MNQFLTQTELQSSQCVIRAYSYDIGRKAQLYLTFWSVYCLTYYSSIVIYNMPIDYYQTKIQLVQNATQIPI